MDALMLGRIQFAANVTFHILFPSITIALAWFLLYFKCKFDSTGEAKWMDAYKLWVKVFALCFALGVVSGITMSFQFGTNWPGFMQKVGNIAGPLLAYEVLTAFFLEATFLGIMLFGYNKVSNKLHTLATILVAAGTTFSAFWILVLNSWMQTPVGYKIIDGKLHAEDWLQILFNPSMPYRMTHMLLASGLTAAFLIAGVSAYRWLRRDRGPSVLAALKASLTVAMLLIPIQIYVGDLHGLNSVKHQPAKIAAMEAVWETGPAKPLVLFAWPDEKTKQNLFEISIPKMASWFLTHDTEGVVRGLSEFQDNHPPVVPVFVAFRVMVGVGILMLLAAMVGLWQLRQNRLTTFGARFLVLMTFSGWVAVVAGWYTTEVGRQPWLVQGVLSVADAAATNVTDAMIGKTLFMYLVLYIVLIIAFISVLFYMARRAHLGGGEPAVAAKKAAPVKTASKATRGKRG